VCILSPSVLNHLSAGLILFTEGISVCGVEIYTIQSQALLVMSAEEKPRAGGASSPGLMEGGTECMKMVFRAMWCGAQG
ncbi:hypothetical protein ACQP3J_30965, partial [Escherichia coli]